MVYYSLKSCIDIPIDEKILTETVLKAKDWALMHGAGMRSKTNFSTDCLNFAPFILTPSSFPRKEFINVVELQPLLNELIHSVANDEQFLRKTLSETIKVDEFTESLFKIYEKVLKIGSMQPISLGLLRSDMMLESRCPFEFDNEQNNPPEKSEYCCWKQVEVNTIASGFGHLGPISKDIQSYVLEELDQNEKLKDLPENKALFGLCDGMIKAWELFGNPKGVILFIIEDVSYNICDQRFHEFEIRKMKPEIRVLRKTLTDISREAKHGPNNELMIGEHVVSVVYFRAGYEPGHYPSNDEWDARLLIELSTAIKSPTINYHLAGTKKVQQALTTPGTLESFISDPSKIKAIRRIFTGLYPLDNSPEGNAAFQMAKCDPERFVLKPQREGGGNNIYGDDIPDALEKMSDEDRTAWILMDRIHPPSMKGYMIRPDGVIPPPIVDLVSELGIFGVIIADSKKIYTNYMAGHMLRTKLSTANEGGVAAGLGALDSPYLID